MAWNLRFHPHSLPTLTEPFSPATERFRMLRVRLDSMALPGGRSPRVIGFTSSLPEEGKTCVSLNTAIAAAQKRDRDRRVLFVECDLRSPSAGTFLVKAPVEGLREILDVGMRLDDVVLKAELPPNLSLLLAGRPPENPVELLGSKNMETLFLAFRQQYDLVIVDLPPALGFADATQIGSHVDTFLIVARHGRVERKALAETHRLLAPYGVAGVVLNAQPRSQARYYSSEPDPGKTTGPVVSP
ncbi:MAG: CpsD/CapB family tyrosine-protein kinase [Acidobacteriota bacterium]